MANGLSGATDEQGLSLPDCLARCLCQRCLRCAARPLPVLSVDNCPAWPHLMRDGSASYALPAKGDRFARGDWKCWNREIPRRSEGTGYLGGLAAAGWG